MGSGIESCHTDWNDGMHCHFPHAHPPCHSRTQHSVIPTQYSVIAVLEAGIPLHANICLDILQKRPEFYDNSKTALFLASKLYKLIVQNLIL